MENSQPERVGFVKDYLKNRASNLKSGSWKLIEKGDNYDALNKSYFNGIPEGYFINYEKQKDMQ